MLILRDCSHSCYDTPPNLALLSLLPSGARRVLDVGCGTGANARLLKDAGIGVYGITVSDMEARSASQFCERVFVHNVEDGLPRDLDGPFDAVLCSHVLEHLANPQPLLSDIKNVLNADPLKQGCLLVALPNIAHWKQRIELLRGRFQYQEVGVLDSTHLRFYTFASGRQLLEATGFEVDTAVVEGHFPLPGIRKVAPGLAKVIDDYSSRRLPGLLGWQMLYRCRPKALG